MSKVDPVTIAVVWGGLVSATQEMGIGLRRTAYSVMVREGHDFSTAIFDPGAHLIAQGDFSPGHLGSIPFAMKTVVRAYPSETVRPGDVILQNDPQIGAGHLPDFCMFYPVFYKDRMVGWTTAIAHMADIGGIGPGGHTVVSGLIDYYQEGLVIPPVKLYEEGKLNEGLLRLVLGNSRLPDQVHGDINAMLNACRVGAARLTALLDIYDLETVWTCMNEIISRSEGVIRNSIRKIPNGSYTFTDFLDDTGPDTEPVECKVKIDIKEDEAVIDFGGSSPQRQCGCNVYYNYTYAYSMFAMRSLIDTSTPQNEGTLRPIHLLIPKGSIFNAEPPAACGARHLLAKIIFETVMGAMAQAVPNRALAASSPICGTVIDTRNPATGKRSIITVGAGQGTGGRSSKDGMESTSIPMNTSNVPIEVFETEFPILIDRYEFIADSAGPGKYRGCMGLRRDIRILSDNARIYNLAERQKFPPYGLFGGKEGSKCVLILNPGPHQGIMFSKGVYDLKKGDVIRLEGAGGGGYGNPLERDLQAVFEDVIKGYVSIEGAQRNYGVFINSETMTVDIEKTKEIRSNLTLALLQLNS